jgi:hypothetical protein
LAECGYTDELLRSDYPFFSDGSKIRRADLVGFSQLPWDVRSACIGVIDRPACDVTEAVASYHELGAPIVFVCNGSLQRWRQTADPKRPVPGETVEPGKVAGYFRGHRSDFAPSKVFRWKTFGRIRPEPQQLDFVDAGLMPAVERELGERLTKRVEYAIDDLCGVFQKPLDKLDAEERGWILESTFYLLAGKLLRDKQVGGFEKLQLADVDDVFRRVTSHYGSERPPRIGSSQQREGLVVAAERFEQFWYLGHITTDTLADVYEAALVDPKKRKALGTHSTPSFIVDWIVWQLLPWIEQMDPDDRHVFEPACGHAPFLVSAMRLLRFLLPSSTSREQAHDYLKGHLHGIDKDDRAREVARLSLTLADVPNPNGWNLALADMFDAKVLEGAAAKAGILLCNPPFERFTEAEQAEYSRKRADLVHTRKAAEMLHRTLPYLPEGAVFGVVLPQAVLRSPTERSVELRDKILREFEISEICLLNDKFFRYADHETALVLGRKTRSRAILLSRFMCRKVREDDTERWAKSYGATTEFDVAQADVAESALKQLWIPDLPGVWEWCESLPRVEEIGAITRGLEYLGMAKLGSRTFTYGSMLPASHRGTQIKTGFAEADRSDRIDGVPESCYMNLNSDVIGNPRGGTDSGKPQVVVSYTRISRGWWRWKGFIDRHGVPFRNRFLGVRPLGVDVPLEYLWAVLNGPLANAFLYCHTMKRENLEGLVQQIPVPRTTPSGVRRIVEHALAYLVEAQKPLSDGGAGGSLFAGARHSECMDRTRVRLLLLRLDAEVLRLYELPAMQERLLLDSFNGQKRPGLPPGVVFDRYYPDGFKETVPLYVYLSSAYAKRRESVGGATMTASERSRWDELTSAKLRRELSPDEERELDALGVFVDADAYVTGGRAAGHKLAELDKDRREMERRLGRWANRVIGREPKGGKRGHQA